MRCALRQRSLLPGVPGLALASHPGYAHTTNAHWTQILNRPQIHFQITRSAQPKAKAADLWEALFVPGSYLEGIGFDFYYSHVAASPAPGFGRTSQETMRCVLRQRSLLPGVPWACRVWQLAYAYTMSARWTQIFEQT